MPNYCSVNNDWFPCSHDPALFKRQFEGIKNMKPGLAWADFRKIFTDVEAECTGRWLGNSHYKMWKEQN